MRDERQVEASGGEDDAPCKPACPDLGADLRSCERGGEGGDRPGHGQAEQRCKRRRRHVVAQGFGIGDLNVCGRRKKSLIQGVADHDKAEADGNANDNSENDAYDRHLSLPSRVSDLSRFATPVNANGGARLISVFGPLKLIFDASRA
ncbi:MAG: hypothetical protein AB7T59_10175 [Hyphomonadaceae bacterium]